MEEQNINTQSQATPPAQALPPIPGSIISLVFGIISLVLCWYFWVPIAGFILNTACLIIAILGMGKGKKAMLAFEEATGQYKQGSYSIAKVGKILGLVGIILNAILLIIAIIVTILGIIAWANF